MQKSQKLRNKIDQRQLKMGMIKKYLRKDINLRKKSDEFNQPSKFRAKNWVKIG